MLHLSARVSRAIRRHALIPPGGRVLVAVSGGSDSVALLHLLNQIARAEQGPGQFTLAGVAHLNHQLRKAESDGDEQFCRDLAVSLGFAFDAGRADVAALARERRTSIEVAAREARYAFLRESAARVHAEVIAVGHTKTDQAETYLLRLLRGAGSRGLAGMAPKQGTMIRPLLSIAREELRAWPNARGLPFREDASNLDVSIPRNRVRHELLPMLISRFTPAAVDVLARNATIAQADEAWLEEQASEAAARVISQRRDGVLALDAEALRALPPALARRVVRRALAGAPALRFCSFTQVDTVLQVAASHDADAVAADVGALRVERIGELVVLRNRGPRRRTGANGWRYALSVPGSIRVPEAACELTARLERWPAGSDVAAFGLGSDAALMDATSARSGLFVRSRAPGDRLRPLGLGGSKKLQDVLVDRKVARKDRDGVPLVVDGSDRILWVAGHLLADGARVTASTQSVVILTLSRSGPLGERA